MYKKFKLIKEIEKNPVIITAGFLECAVTPKGEILSRGKSIGWMKEFEGFVLSLEEIM